VIGAFQSLSPGVAAWKLFGHEAALKLDLSGLNTVSIPYDRPRASPVRRIHPATTNTGPAINASAALGRKYLQPDQQILESRHNEIQGPHGTDSKGVSAAKHSLGNGFAVE
jgi:hypothetical protein